MDLRDLYRDVILDHNRHPRNFGRLERADAQAEGHNPLCGDRLTLSLRLQGDRIEDIRFEGKGCAISTASASLMSEAVKGKDRSTVRRLFESVHALLTRHDAAAQPAELGKLAALSGVREFPARVKCASLCWHTLNAALEQSGGTITTEVPDEVPSSAAERLAGEP
ncbi:MAG TPA: SUF system NifU family Fe-S cluster assembly protein [Steroidobacteraceae bacterium]|nr:SUF system NifU family Fe-S cluster assembly protein [Steroidobacteraceae bacterium]